VGTPNPHRTHFRRTQVFPRRRNAPHAEHSLLSCRTEYIIIINYNSFSNNASAPHLVRVSNRYYILISTSNTKGHRYIHAFALREKVDKGAGTREKVPFIEMVPEAATECAQSDLKKVEINALALYDTFPLWRKSVLIFVASWSTLRVCSSSASLLSASSEIAQGFGTTPNVIDLYTGGLLFAIGNFALIWEPVM
jgi:hypothetical protein